MWGGFVMKVHKQIRKGRKATLIPLPYIFTSFDVIQDHGPGVQPQNYGQHISVVLWASCFEAKHKMLVLSLASDNPC